MKDGKFVVYDEVVRKSLGESDRRSLDQLQARYKRVELLGIGEREWCVRVIHIVRDGLPEPLPLAAIGRTPQLAAERLWRIGTFYDADVIH